MPSRASIVIPAHNEEYRIRHLLDSLSDSSIKDMYDVYVICNGCTDQTRQVAEEYPGIVVIEIQDVGKHHALNEGDRLAGDVFPRLYCDADVQVSPASIQTLVEILRTEETLAAGPVVRYSVQDSTWLVRMYYRAHESRVITTWSQDHLVGRGIYGCSGSARNRFADFPNMFADDLFFDSQFALSEKKIVPECVATIWVPNNVRSLIRGELRVAEGNQRYRESGDHGPNEGPALVRSWRYKFRLKSRMAAVRNWTRMMRSEDIVPLLVYLGVGSTARTLLAAKKARGIQIPWR